MHSHKETIKSKIRSSTQL